jgi:hypothetical protein
LVRSNSKQMKKIIAIIYVFILAILSSYGQSLVIHKDLLEQLAKNEAYRTAMHSTYDSTLSGIKKARNTITTAAGAIQVVQDKVFSSLTNVSDGIRNVRTLGYISQYAISTLDNVGTAITLAAGKPYLVDAVSKDATVFYERIAELTGFVSGFIMNESTDQLIKPTERDRFLYTVYRQIMVLDALSSNLCSNLKKWKLQDAVYNVVPFNRYYNNDLKIINNILQGWTY